MKKYIIKDSFGNIKIIYANNLSHALKVYDSCIVKVDNDYIMQSDRPEMTSLKKYAKIFSSEQEARDYARKYFRLKSSDIEIIRG